MDYLSRNVALNLKRIRTSKCMSLDAVSEQTGVSKSMLAQIEKGTANPSLGVLGKISSGLRIEFQELLQEPPAASCLVNTDNMMPTKEAENKYKVWTCFPYEDNRKFEIYKIEIQPGCAYISGGHGEKTREYVSVLEGEIEIECIGEKTVVKKSEVFRFETDQIHKYLNHTSEIASFICFFLDYR